MESSRSPNIKEEYDPRVAMLKKATMGLAAWCPDMEGILYDIQKECPEVGEEP